MDSRTHIYLFHLVYIIKSVLEIHGCSFSLDYNTTEIEEGDMFTMKCSWTPDCDIQTEKAHYMRWSRQINRFMGAGWWITVAEFYGSASGGYSSMIYPLVAARGLDYSRAYGVLHHSSLSYSITITNVTFYDGETWVCGFEYQDPQSNTLNLVVTVTPVPSDIIFTRLNIGPILADSSETFTCHVPRVFPEAYVIWNINDETINGSGILSEIEFDSYYPMYSLNETITYNVTYGQRDLSVACTVYTAGNKRVRPDNGFDFVVKAAPKGTPNFSLRNSLPLSNSTFRMGIQSTLSCSLSTEGYNTQTNTIFYINDTIIGESTNDVLTFSPNTSFGWNPVAWCKKHNDIGESLPSNKIEVVVEVAPLGTPSLSLTSKSLRVGIQTTMSCTLDTEEYTLKRNTTFYINDAIIGESVNDLLSFTPNSIFGPNPAAWCRKYNDVGESLPSNKIKIEVEAPSTLEYISTNVTGVHDIRKGVTLVCIAAGTSVNIAWKTQDGDWLNHLFHTQTYSAIKGIFSYGQTTALRSEIHLKTSDELEFSCEDIGKFKQNIYCEIGDMADSSTIMSNPINVTLMHHPIRTTESGIQHTSGIGENKYLICSVCSNPPVRSYEWYFNHKPLLAKSNILPNGTLRIGSVALSDYGTYICTVKNDIGVRRYSIVLTQEPQEITSMSENEPMGNAYFIGMIVTSGGAAVSLIICIVLVVLFCRKAPLLQGSDDTPVAAENVHEAAMKESENVTEHEYADIELVATYESTNDVPDDYLQSYQTLK